MTSKQTLRNEARDRRATLARALPDFAQTIAAFADDLAIPEGAVVAGYWPMRDEADPRGVMAALASRGHPLALPRVENGKALAFHAWREGDVTHQNTYGIDEPHVESAIVTPAVILVPLLAFDASGHRLGYGGGYYDRTLETLRANGKVMAIGIAYAGQETASIPRDTHDQRLDMIFTERGIGHFR